MTVIGNNVMSRRLADVLEVIEARQSVLTQALQKIVHSAPRKLSWSGAAKDASGLMVPVDETEVSCFEAVSGDGGLIVVYHVNLLTGDVLVNGNPTKGLPLGIRNHPVYRRVFGAMCNFEVADSAIPGVLVTTKALQGHLYYRFGLGDNGRLLVEEKDERTVKVTLLACLFVCLSACLAKHVLRQNLTT